MNFLLAQTTPTDRLQLPVSKSSLDLTLLFVAIGLIVLLLIVWAVFFRRSDDEVSGWGPSRSNYKSGSGRTAEGSGSRKRRKWRRRRRDHRPRNPTLAETGGLPPARADESSEPGQ